VNELYRNLIRERVRFALAAAKTSATVEHNGAKGALRESLMSELLRPLLPPDFGVATGIIISADNVQSAQQDIIIYNRRILPPFLTEGPALVPVESVVATIEVKSVLDATELKSAFANAKTVRKPRLLSGIYGPDGATIAVRVTDEQGNLLPPSPTPPASAVTSFLFAFASDLKEKSEIDRFTEHCDDAYIFTAICVSGKGFFGPDQPVFYDWDVGKYLSLKDPSQPMTNRLVELQPADGAHSEVLLLIANLHRLVNKVANTRGYPPLAGYLFDS
jgi:hypothetical protein